MSDVALACSCGAVRGEVRGLSPQNGNHLVCYCDDCQSFVHFLGRAWDTMDAHGGTEILQTSPARLTITEGRDHLACMRLRPNGLLRWYADCCKSPLANTQASGRVPFVGLFCCALGSSAEVETAVGPIRARVNARFAQGDRGALDAFERWSLPMILRFARLVIGARLRGDQRRSPFFDAETRALAATPRVLTEAELGEVEAARDAGAEQGLR